MWSSYLPPTASKKGVPLVIGLVLFAAGMLFLSLAIGRDARRAVFGVHAFGEVTKLTQRTTSDRSPRRSGESRSSYRARRGRGGGVSTIISVRFTPEGGSPIDIDTLATWGYRAEVGERVELVYPADAPDDAEIYATRQIWLPIATGATLGLICLVGGLAMVWVQIRPR